MLMVFTDLLQIRKENCVKVGESTEQEQGEKLDVFTEKRKGYDLGCLKEGGITKWIWLSFFAKTAKWEIVGFVRETINRELTRLLVLQIFSAKLQEIFPEKIMFILKTSCYILSGHKSSWSQLEGFNRLDSWFSDSLMIVTFLETGLTYSSGTVTGCELWLFEM